MRRKHSYLLAAVALTMAIGFAHAAADKRPPREIFSALLVEYKRYSEFFPLLAKGEKTYDDVNPKAIDSVSDKVMQARYTEFNSNFLRYEEIERKLTAQIQSLQKRLDDTPLTDSQNRPDLEVKTAAAKSRQKQVRKVLFLLSVDANNSFLNALKTSPVEKRAAQAATQITRPDLPGIFGGSSAERATAKPEDKLNLTPVDPEFYATRVGKKLEKDLSGRADYWSYDFDKDELYVQVGKEVGKLRVRASAGGARFVQTRVGANFQDPLGSDLKVDPLVDKGRFMTGDSNEETLFGPFPKTDTKFVDENKKSKDH